MPPPEIEVSLEAHQAWLAGVAEEGRALFADIGNLLAEVDELLLMSDGVLNYSQPPMDGKLGLRFWRRGRPDGRLEPVVVVWHKNRRGRFWPEQVKGHLANRVRRRGAFELNAGVTVEAVAILDKLLKMRKGMAMLLYRTRQSVNSLKAQHRPVLDFQRKRLAELRATSETNLDSLCGEPDERARWEGLSMAKEN